MFCAGSEPSRCRFRRGKQYERSAGGLFFSAGPVSAYPVLDLKFVSFKCPAFRALRRQAQGVQQAADMIDMIRDAPPFADQGGHARTGPQVGRKTCRFGATNKPLFQTMFLGRGQTGRPTGCRSGSNAIDAVSPIAGVPSANATPVYANLSSHLDRRLAFFKQLNCSFSTFLQVLWAAEGPHISPPAQSIGHLLCRSQ